MGPTIQTWTMPIVGCKAVVSVSPETQHNGWMQCSRHSTNLHSVCLLEFIVLALHFVDRAALVVEGSVAIELGPGSVGDQARATFVSKKEKLQRHCPELGWQEFLGDGTATQ